MKPSKGFEECSTDSNENILKSADNLTMANNSSNNIENSLANTNNSNNVPQTSTHDPLQINTPSLLNPDSTTHLIGNSFINTSSAQEFSPNPISEAAQKSPNRSISSTSDYSSSAYSETPTDSETMTKTPIDNVVDVSTSPVPIVQKPDGRLRVKTLCFLGALLPGLGCYLCIAYTYLFQIDRVMNFTSIDCNGLKSTFPPVSYSIGVWKPQKYFWLLILSAHLPFRMFFGIMYKNQFSLTESEYKSRTWYPRMIKLHIYLMWLEASGLISVSVIDIESNFVIHAIFYSVWIITFNFNMLFNTILHHHSGIRGLTPQHETTFFVKCVLLAIGYPLSVSTGFSYLTYSVFCSGVAYALFSMAEYILVGFNSLFYFLLVWEMRGSRIEMYLKHKEHMIPRKI